MKNTASEIRKLAQFSKKTFGSTLLGNKCAYCGVYADSRDHIIPISFFSIGRPSNYASHYKVNNIVKCCNECNTLASNTVFNTFLEKKEYLLDRVGDRYYSLLNSPDWKQEEIDELAGTLKKTVENSRAAKEFIKYRIENLKIPHIHE